MADSAAQDGSVVVCPHCGRRNRVPLAASGKPRCGNCHEFLPWVVDGDDAVFDRAVEETTLLVVVDLWAPWCGPCRLVEPALKEAARKYAGELKVVRVNVDESPRTAGRFAVQSIPLLLFMKNGLVIDRLVGAVPFATLEQRVRAALSGAEASASA
ncbi:MAG: Thioredoxin [Acidimicrobiaceae bacterium]|nr:Thioredoxin [Acidimicrobiaceae bacterium]